MEEAAANAEAPTEAEIEAQVAAEVAAARGAQLACDVRVAQSRVDGGQSWRDFALAVASKLAFQEEEEEGEEVPQPVV